MTRPWSPAEIAGAKALMRHVDPNCPWDDAFLIEARTVLDAAGAALRAEAIDAVHVAICEGSLDDCIQYRGRCVKAVEALAAQVRGAGAGEQA